MVRGVKTGGVYVSDDAGASFRGAASLVARNICRVEWHKYATVRSCFMDRGSIDGAFDVWTTDPGVRLLGALAPAVALKHVDPHTALMPLAWYCTNRMHQRVVRCLALAREVDVGVVKGDRGHISRSARLEKGKLHAALLLKKSDSQNFQDSPHLVFAE